MMTSNTLLTVALAAGLLLISVCDVGANPVAEKSADMGEPDIAEVEPEPMTEEDMMQLLIDCAVARVTGLHLTPAQVYRMKMAVNSLTKHDVKSFILQNSQQPAVVAQQAMGFLLEQCLMPDVGDISNAQM